MKATLQSLYIVAEAQINSGRTCNSLKADNETYEAVNQNTNEKGCSFVSCFLLMHVFSMIMAPHTICD